MRQSERDLLERIHGVLGDIPRPALGSQSTTAAGLLAYSQDMQAAVPWVRKAIKGLALDGARGWTPGIDYKDPRETLAMLERWVKARRATGWQMPVPSVESFAALAEDRPDPIPGGP